MPKGRTEWAEPSSVQLQGLGSPMSVHQVLRRSCGLRMKFGVWRWHFESGVVECKRVPFHTLQRLRYLSI